VHEESVLLPRLLDLLVRNGIGVFTIILFFLLLFFVLFSISFFTFFTILVLVIIFIFFFFLLFLFYLGVSSLLVFFMGLRGSVLWELLKIIHFDERVGLRPSFWHSLSEQREVGNRQTTTNLIS
jgi:hypothetical protein